VKHVEFNGPGANRELTAIAMTSIYAFTIIDAESKQGLKGFSHYDSYFWRINPEERIPLTWEVAWCHCCEDFVEAEKLPDLSQVITMIAELEATRDDWNQIEAEQFAHELEFWKELGSNRTKLPHTLPTRAVALKYCCNLRKMLESRRSPPRCLLCGSMFGVKFFPISDEYATPHPADQSRTIQIEPDCALVSYRCLPREIEYDIEGNRLTLDLRPVPW